MLPSRDKEQATFIYMVLKVLGDASLELRYMLTAPFVAAPIKRNEIV
jgi:hypothetical protein